MEIAWRQKLIWNGKVPLRIILGNESCFISASRISYLPLYDAQISRYFGRLVAASTFSFTNGTPIPWHLPIGIVYDMRLLCDSDEPAEFLELHVPLKLDLLQAIGIDQVASAFYGRLKEADALSSGSSVPKVIPVITSSQQAAIFNTIVTGNPDKHCQQSAKM